jgi:hypothetical protein
MHDQGREAIKAQVRDAFAEVERPGNWALAGSTEGFEPGRVAQEFADKDDWRTIDAAFLDQSPGGLSSALSFLSDEAFRYFLPAFLLADLDGALDAVDPAFHLWHGLTDDTKSQRVNPRRYGDRTWLDSRRHKFAVFTEAEARAIVAYLRHRQARDPLDAERIAEALRNYWLPRARLPEDERSGPGAP